MITPRCCDTTRDAGEDPIGTAVRFDALLAVEIPLPWPHEVWDAPHIPAGLAAVFNGAMAQTLKLRPQALLPRDDTPAGHIRVLYYTRPTEETISTYDRVEYLVPDTAVFALVQALVEQPDNLPEFTSYQHETAPIRDIFVCTHGSRDTCCGTLGVPTLQALQSTYASDTLRVHRTSHIGGHRFAATLLDMPAGQYWAFVEPGMLDSLVRRRGNVKALSRHYRGWACLEPPAQAVERAMFMQIGWPWLSYRKSLTVVSQADGISQVRVAFAAPDNGESGAVEATVDSTGRVSILKSTGDTEWFNAPQHRVTKLVKVA